MLDIFVRIQKVDRDGWCSRDFHPTADMEGCTVRVTQLETKPWADDINRNARPMHVFHGVIVDANGDDVSGGEVVLMEHEIERFENMPKLFGRGGQS